MLINEIVEPRATKERIPQAKNALGGGAVATVYPHETDPHVVVKKEKSHSPSFQGEMNLHSRHDAFAYFVDAIAPYIQSNPYLPRVYVKNSRENSKTGVTSYTYVIERLYERPSVFADYGQSFSGESKTNAEMLDVMARKILLDPSKVTEGKTAISKWSTLVELVGYAIQSQDYKNIKDKKVIEAGELIHQAREKMLSDWQKIRSDWSSPTDVRGHVRGLVSGVNIDLHAGNFMIRMTPVGPQLVIIDPLYSY